MSLFSSSIPKSKKKHKSIAYKKQKFHSIYKSNLHLSRHNALSFNIHILYIHVDVIKITFIIEKNNNVMPQKNVSR